MWKGLATLGIFFGSIFLMNKYGIVNPNIPSGLIFVGCLSFFIGPDATSGGFFARGMYVNSGTPAILWRVFGGILWISAAILAFYIKLNPERFA